MIWCLEITTISTPAIRDGPRALLCLSLCIVALATLATTGHSAEPDDDRFVPLDVFQLEFASDPQISPDGRRVVYVRNFMDIMQDKRRSNLWIVDFDGSNHRPLTMGNNNDELPRWSPDGRRIAYVAKADGSWHIFCRWLESGDTAKLTNLTSSPANLVWSPLSDQLAFSMLVRANAEPFATLPTKPKGAQWAEPARVITKLKYRFDGKGYLDDGFHHLFILPADGGSPRQLSTGDFDHIGKPAWTADGRALIFSTNRNPDWEYEPRRTYLYRISLDDRRLTRLTDVEGPSTSPVVSKDDRIAYVGYKDRLQGYQVKRLFMVDPAKEVTGMLDRNVVSPVWSHTGDKIYFQFDDHGTTKLGLVTTDGRVQTLAMNLGGTTIGRPYSASSFSVSRNERFAYTGSRSDRPADVWVGDGDAKPRRITSLNEDLLGHKRLGRVDEIQFRSTFDDRLIQGWVVKPPNYKPGQKYPLILEIHGGPFANYGPRFSAEMQLYATAGYIVFYANPRGSTGYGEEFGNLIHHAYPGQDFDDLMSGVYAMMTRDDVDPDALFVTGGSGGGVLTSWIVGKTNRFRAAVDAKPVINWYSFALTSDIYPFFHKYWFLGLPWEHPEHYMRRSPISLVGNVTTPTMLLTGEVDYRTPISESEQFYQALKLRKIDTALVRIPDASHGIAARPSNLISKVAHILKWFETHRTLP